MTKELKDAILAFLQDQPRSTAEIADHLYLTMQKHADHRFISNSLKNLICIGLVKQCENRRRGMARCNTYMATTLDERVKLEDSKRKVSTPSPAFINDPIMAAFYSKVNI